MTIFLFFLIINLHKDHIYYWFVFLKDLHYFVYIFSRLNYIPNNTKRAKDNSGSGYSYGNSVNVISPSRSKSPPTFRRSLHCSCKDQAVPARDDMFGMHILRTTAINNDRVEHVPTIPVVSLKFYLNCIYLKFKYTLNFKFTAQWFCDKSNLVIYLY